MSRRIYARVDLAIDGEWRVGVWETGDRNVLTFTTDRGQPHLPGASIRGSLRSHVRRVDGATLAEAAFGPDAGASRLHASPWWVLAAQLPPGTWGTRERGQTAIDRTRRAPADRTQRTSRTVTAVGDGPHLRAYLRCDLPAGESADPLTLPVAGGVLRALGTWRPRIGGGASVGLGRATVTAVRYRLIDLTTRDGLLARLGAQNGPTGLDTLLDDPETGTITIRQHPDSRLLTCDFQLPHGWAAPEPPAPVRSVMDGSTWKGVIRSRVEFIGRSLGIPVCLGSDCGECDVCNAFGSPKAAGALDFASTTIRRHDGSRVRTRKRNAINRFTGGVNDRQLFDEHTEHDLTIRLEVLPLNRRAPADDQAAPSDQAAQGDQTSPGEWTSQVADWVTRAVLHAVRDLADGLIAVGGRSSTGLGTLQATSLRLGGPWRNLAVDIAAPDGTVPLDALDRFPVKVTR